MGTSDTAAVSEPLSTVAAMPSLIHEGLILMVRDHPELLAQLARELLHVEVPPFTNAQLVEATLNELVPAEFHADAAVLLYVDGEAVFGAIVEAQLTIVNRKLFTWPVYATVARSRHDCPFIVIVVTPDRGVMEWAARPIDLGGGNFFRAHVIGPEGIPIITDPKRGAREVHLTMLSAIAHGRGDPQTAVAIANAAVAGIKQLPEDKRVIYTALVERSLGEAARKAFEMLPETPAFLKEFYEYLAVRAEAEGKAEGEAKGNANAVLQILGAREIAVTDEQRQRILDCRDLELFKRWIPAAMTVQTIEELLAIA